MLPGYRFLFAAIMLLLSILIFGLAQRPLLRAAHEELPAIHHGTRRRNDICAANRSPQT